METIARIANTLMLPFPIESEAANFNEYFSYVMGYGVELLLPCVIGIIHHYYRWKYRHEVASHRLRNDA